MLTPPREGSGVRQPSSSTVAQDTLLHEGAGGVDGGLAKHQLPEPQRRKRAQKADAYAPWGEWPETGPTLARDLPRLWVCVEVSILQPDDQNISLQAALGPAGAHRLIAGFYPPA